MLTVVVDNEGGGRVVDEENGFRSKATKATPTRFSQSSMDEQIAWMAGASAVLAVGGVAKWFGVG
jgi:hypothetical protein